MSDTDYFSGFEVIRAAMEVEKNGHRFYSSMVEKAYTDLAREMFAMLAQDEVVHLQTLEKLAPKYQDGEFWENEAEFLPYLQRFNDKEIFPTAEQVDAANPYATRQPHFPARAERVLMVFCSGALSHVDTFD